MRARNIKPALFKNEVLGVADPLLTILFEGLWCEADREGRIEDRPLRLKAEIFPYRNNADVEAMLDWLAEHGFISRYVARGVKVIQVLKFLEHQHPHKNEAPSVLPSMGVREHDQGTKSDEPRHEVLPPTDDALGLIPSSLIPDSPSLIADPLSTRTTKARSPSDQGTKSGNGHVEPWNEPEEHEGPERAEYNIRRNAMDGIKADWPAGGRAHWIQAEHAASLLVAKGAATWDELHERVRTYGAFCRATGRLVMDPHAFFGAPDEPWKQAWTIPQKVAGGIPSIRVAKSADELEALERARASQ